MEENKNKIRVGLVARLHNAGLGVDDLAKAWGLSLEATCLKLCGVTKTFVHDYFNFKNAFPQLEDDELFADFILFHEDKELAYLLKNKKEQRKNGNKSYIR